jgi:hypothetical protein
MCETGWTLRLSRGPRLSPKGTAVNSQGREPLVRGELVRQSPNGAMVRGCNE